MKEKIIEPRVRSERRTSGRQVVDLSNSMKAESTFEEKDGRKNNINNVWCACRLYSLSVVLSLAPHSLSTFFHFYINHFKPKADSLADHTGEGK